jgi:hypothetical protein
MAAVFGRQWGRGGKSSGDGNGKLGKLALKSPYRGGSFRKRERDYNPVLSAFCIMWCPDSTIFFVTTDRSFGEYPISVFSSSSSPLPAHYQPVSKERNNEEGKSIFPYIFI